MKYTKIVLKTLHALLYLGYTSCIPKDKNLWVFGSWKGRNYSDNSKELFEYVCREHPEINAVWIAKNQKVYDEVKATGNKVVLYPSKEAKYLVAHAAVNVQTESNEDTGRFRVGGTKIIQLFHGYGAMKEPHLFAGMGELKKRIVKIYADNHAKSYWMVPSEYFVDRCPQIYETDTNKMFVTGQPRIDLLLRMKKKVYFEKFKSSHPNSKMILYVPTHRNYGLHDDVFIKDYDWERMNQYLIEKNEFLFFKPHPLEIEKYNSINNYSNIILLTIIPEMVDAYEYLHYFDALISDYSSIATDFLLFDRPVVHFVYDWDSFSTDKMPLDKSNNFICGPICKDWNELYGVLDSIFLNDEYRDIREKTRKIAFKYRDGNNCERVFSKIQELITDNKAK